LEEHTPSVSQIVLLLCVWRSFESKKLFDFQKVDEKEFHVLIKHYFIKANRLRRLKRRVKVREIASAVSIWTERVPKILLQHLNMRKLSARWVPQLLTVDQKRDRVRCSRDNLQLFQRNPQDFRHRFVTVDETWMHHYTPETKEQSKQWVPSGESAPKKAKTVPSAGKVMVTVFWDSQAIILINYLEKGKIITDAPYSLLLNRLKTELQEKCP
jgi:histone-lysine N-methyltransferase SETMAR